MTAWQPLDCHAHSTFSDGVLSPDDVIATAAARQVRGTVSDHASRDVAYALKSVLDVQAYADAIAHLPYRSAEFCSHDALWRDLPASLLTRFTHRIGSLHAVRLADGTLVRMFQQSLPAGLTAAAYMRQHVAAVEALTAEMPVEIFAHPTLLPHDLRALPPEELWSEAIEERLVQALARAGICFEVSNRYRAHPRLIQRAAAHGVRLSLGSDGHRPAQIGDIAWPLEMAREAGATDASLYDPLVHGTRLV